MLSKFYIQAQDDDAIFALHATTSFSLDMPSKATEFPVQSKINVSDNIVRMNDSGTLSGVVTDIYTTIDSSQYLISYELIKQLKDKIDNKQLFTIYFSEEIEPLENCYATSFNISKDNTLGGESWNISFTYKQIRIAQESSFTILPSVDVEESVAKRQEATQNKEKIVNEVSVCLFAVNERKKRTGYLTGEEDFISNCRLIAETNPSARLSKLRSDISDLGLTEAELTKVNDEAIRQGINNLVFTGE